MIKFSDAYLLNDLDSGGIGSGLQDNKVLGAGDELRADDDQSTSPFYRRHRTENLGYTYLLLKVVKYQNIFYRV